MGYVILQLAASIDGYISRLDHSVDFLNEMDPKLTEQFNQFIDKIDTIIMGSKSYEVMLGFGEIPFSNKKIYVLTNKIYEKRYDFVQFTNDDIGDIVKQNDGYIWLFGGSTVIQSFLNKGLIDEFQIHYVPHILGDGIPLFLKSTGLHNLTLVSHEQFGNSITLTYKK